MDNIRKLSEAHENSVAVIGMAGRFRGAENCDELWSLLQSGKEMPATLSEKDLDEAFCPKEHRAHPFFMPVTAQLDRVDCFDASFFGFTPSEAREMDPQFRLLLETSWHAFEDAGYVPSDSLSALTGVFGGVSPSFYLWLNARADINAYKSMAFNHTFMLNAHDFVTTWISYKLGLRGPSIALQTACSTGLVAVATACQNLLDYSCDRALAVSASVFSPRGWGYWAEAGGIFSPDGHCRPFDSQANGTIMGEGVCALLLKRFQDALRDGDRIHGIIRGFAVNNDGLEKAGFTAPSPIGQATVIRTALEASQVYPEEIGYLEAHGTGTHLGDPIEFEGLTAVFKGLGEKRPLGSLKANLGHLGSAAGMASLLKVLLMMRHKEIPPQINFKKPNPNIALEKSAFRIAPQGEAWGGDKPRLAGVSSLGFGGTNCHVIVEECPEWSKPEAADAISLFSESVTHCLMVSAPTPESLKRQIEALSSYLVKDRPSLASVAWTLSQRRKHFPFRVAIVATSPEEASQKLQALYPSLTKSKKSTLYFRFSPFSGGESRARYLLHKLQVAWPELASGPSASHMEEGKKDIRNGRCCLLAHLLFCRLAELYGLKAQAYICEGRIGRLSAAVASNMLAEEEAIWLLENPSSGLEEPWTDSQSPRVPLIDSNLEDIARTWAEKCASSENVFSKRNCLMEGVAEEEGFTFTISKTGESEKTIRVFSISSVENLREDWLLALTTLYSNGVTPCIPRSQEPLATLPFYVFDPQPHWLDAVQPMAEATSNAGGSDLNEPYSLEAVLSVWRGAFGLPEASEEDDFFMLGGTSMIAIEIIASIHALTGIQISMADFMKIRTAKHLYAMVIHQIRTERETL